MPKRAKAKKKIFSQKQKLFFQLKIVFCSFFHFFLILCSRILFDVVNVSISLILTFFFFFFLLRFIPHVHIRMYVYTWYLKGIICNPLWLICRSAQQKATIKLFFFSVFFAFRSVRKVFKRKKKQSDIYLNNFFFCVGRGCQESTEMYFVRVQRKPYPKYRLLSPFAICTITSAQLPMLHRKYIQWI